MNTCNIEIEVTKEDIEQGTPRSSDGCAMALALHREIPDGEVNCVHELYADLSNGYINFPEKARKFIRAFDSRSIDPEDAPFRFDMEIVYRGNNDGI